MRTAITLGKRHDGKWEIVSGPDVPILEQRTVFRDCLSLKVNEQHSEIFYQESDGNARVVRFANQKQLEARLAAEEKFKADLEAKRRKHEEDSRKAAEALNLTLKKQIGKAEQANPVPPFVPSDKAKLNKVTK